MMAALGNCRLAPLWPRAVLGGVASELIGDANEQFGPPGQVPAQIGVITKRFWDCGFGAVVADLS
jgi:hypothetical protein